MRESSSVSHISDGFLARLDEVVERSAGAVVESISSFGRPDEGLAHDVRLSVRESVVTLAKMLSHGRQVSRDDLQLIERLGARRAEAGIPLDDVLRSFRTVSRCCYEILSEECKGYEGDALTAAIDVGEAVLRYTDQISTAVARGYAKAQRSIVKQQEGQRREFLSELLYGVDVPAEDILRKAHAFGYDLSVNYLAMVGQGPELPMRPEVAVASAASNATSNGATEPIVLERAEHTVALLPSDSPTDPGIVPEKLAAGVSSEWTFGLGGPEPGLDGVRRAYLEAREALEIGTALELDGPVYRFDDLILYHFLRVEPALVDRFVDQMLGPLLEYDERRKGELIKTLESYFDSDGSVKSAGEALFAHPHTVTYRLKQIQKLTGFSLRNAEDKLKLQLGLRARRLAQLRRDDL